MDRRFLIVPVLLALLLVVPVLSHAAEIILVNQGFETGDLTGWTSTTAGDGWAKALPSWNPQLQGDAGFSNPPGTYKPVNGNYFGAIKADGAPGIPTVLSQKFSANVGDTLHYWVFFDSEDYKGAVPGQWDDNFNVKIVDPSSFASFTLFQDNVLSHPNYYNGPWTPVEWIAPATSSTWEIQATIYNYGDTVLDSVGGLDVPEPSSLALLPMALFGVAMWRRRRSDV